MNIRPLPLLCIGLLLAGCATTRPVRPVASVPPAITGVASCDGYLSSYLACHRAAAIYPADQLQAHYQAMRSSLLQSARDPQVQPYLDARCRLLENQMLQSLQGRTCAAAPAN
ncbi:MAG: hypothetical protein RSP_09600 [Rhodanobacter sp.]